jgi:hypothetical protein
MILYSDQSDNSASAIDEKLSGDIVVDHDDEGPDDKVDRIGEDGNVFLKIQEII